jgi:DNA-binding beta-propeller fold protein YncE
MENFKTHTIAVLIIIVAALVVVGCNTGASSTASEPQIIIQTGKLEPAAAPEGPSGWDTEFSQRLGIKLLASFDSSGDPAWDPAEHPTVFITSEGPGYGGFLSTVTTPGLTIIDADTHEIVATRHYDLGIEEYFESHGLGVSYDGQFIYVPTGVVKAGVMTQPDLGGAGESGGVPTTDPEVDAELPGRWLVINARTLKLHQIIGTRSVPHHAKTFKNAEGQELVLGEDFNWQVGRAYMRPGSGIYVFDPKDDNRVVGGINADSLQGNPYLSFASPSGEFVYIGLPPGPIRDPDIRHKLEGTWAVVSTKDWAPVKYYKGGFDPIWTAFSSDGKFAYLCDGGSDEIFKVDTEEQKIVEASRSSVHGVYGCHLGWDDNNLWTIEKGEASHNRGKNIGLVDVKIMRPLDNWNTEWLRADHGTVHPDPDKNELWVTANSSFEVVVWDMGNSAVKARIPMPNGGSTHSGAFVQYNSDFSGQVVSDQNGLQGPALEKKREMVTATAQK